MNLEIVQRIINSKNKYDFNFDVKNIKTNSKEIENGDIFLALNSGYLYAEEAIQKGAHAIITDQDLNVDIPVLKVSDTKKALKSLASYYRNLYNGHVIAITGSNGKTTTKELLCHVLSKKYNVLSTPNSENNILGISNTLLKLNNKYDFLVLELGMNHKGEISELSNLVKPDIGIITNIGSSHIGFLGSRENIFKAKLEILDGNSDMALYVNGNDEYLNRLNAIKVIPNKEFENVNIISASLVFEVVKNLGFKEEEINELIKDFNNIESRMQNHHIKNHLVIDDAYNASYESFKYGLEQIEKYPERKIIIFGDVLELGVKSAYYHQKIYDEIQKLENKVIITLGQETKFLENKNHFHNLEELKSFLSVFPWYDNDLIYLKASHMLELSSLIGFFQNLW